MIYVVKLGDERKGYFEDYKEIWKNYDYNLTVKR